MGRRLVITLGAVVCVLACLQGAIASSTRSTRPAATSKAWCAGAIAWSAARGRVGHAVRVKARVVRSFYASSSTGRPTFIDLGRAYPNPSRLTLLIWSENRGNFPSAPERMFSRGRLVCAQGVVSVYRGVSEIEIAAWDRRARLMRG